MTGVMYLCRVVDGTERRVTWDNQEYVIPAGGEPQLLTEDIALHFSRKHNDPTAAPQIALEPYHGKVSVTPEKPKAPELVHEGKKFRSVADLVKHVQAQAAAALGGKAPAGPKGAAKDEKKPEDGEQPGGEQEPGQGTTGE
jgi:hypothetical protein